jgi:hypothetical protein
MRVMQKFRFHLIFGACFGTFVAVISWLLISPESPVQTFLPSLQYFFGAIQFVAAFIAMTLSGQPHLGAIGEVIYWVLVLAQWFVVGFGISFLFRLRRHHDVA